MTPAVLEAVELAKAYRKGFSRQRNPVLRGASLELRPGELVALIGENGAGKSTLVRLLVGMDSPDSGTVERRGPIGYCPQAPTLYSRLTVDEHFRLFGRVAGIPEAAIDERSAELLGSLSFDGWRDVPSQDLSGGTKAKLNLSLALLNDPAVLLLDEPYAGFDWETYVRFWDLARQRAERGRAVLVVTHIVMDEERSRFDRCLRIDGGVVEEVSG